MDLKETVKGNLKRHPWEVSRLSALRHILASVLFEGMKVLDIGCGDGFVASGLFGGIRRRDVIAVDPNLSEEQVEEFAAATSRVSFQRELPSGGAFDLVLLLDVLEHVEEDGAFLRDVVTRYLDGKGAVMITVPAFQSIFSAHDAFLGHYRRYSLPELVKLVEASGLDVRRSGYLFSSLLLPKLLLFKLMKAGNSSDGVGNWRGGRLITFLLVQALTIDNTVLLAAGRLGIKIPGLTGWVLCEKRG